MSQATSTLDEQDVKPPRTPFLSGGRVKNIWATNMLAMSTPEAFERRQRKVKQTKPFVRSAVREPSNAPHRALRPVVDLQMANALRIRDRERKERAQRPKNQQTTTQTRMSLRHMRAVLPSMGRRRPEFDSIFRMLRNDGKSFKPSMLSDEQVSATVDFVQDDSTPSQTVRKVSDNPQFEDDVQNEVGIADQEKKMFEKSRISGSSKNTLSKRVTSHLRRSDVDRVLSHLRNDGAVFMPSMLSDDETTTASVPKLPFKLASSPANQRSKRLSLVENSSGSSTAMTEKSRSMSGMWKLSRRLSSKNEDDKETTNPMFADNMAVVILPIEEVNEVGVVDTVTVAHNSGSGVRAESDKHESLELSSVLQVEDNTLTSDDLSDSNLSDDDSDTSSDLSSESNDSSDSSEESNSSEGEENELFKGVNHTRVGSNVLTKEEEADEVLEEFKSLISNRSSVDDACQDSIMSQRKSSEGVEFPVDYESEIGAEDEDENETALQTNEAVLLNEFEHISVIGQHLQPTQANQIQQQRDNTHNMHNTKQREREQQQQADDNTKVFARNLPMTLQLADVKKRFGRCGEIIDANLFVDPVTNQSRGIAFITFKTRRMAQRAVATLHNTHIKQRSIKVNLVVQSLPDSPTTHCVKPLVQRSNGKRLSERRREIVTRNLKELENKSQRKRSDTTASSDSGGSSTVSATNQPRSFWLEANEAGENQMPSAPSMPAIPPTAVAASLPVCEVSAVNRREFFSNPIRQIIREALKNSASSAKRFSARRDQRTQK